MIGPVRSARPYYVEVAKGLDALYVHHGWSEKAQKMLESGYVDSLNGLFMMELYLSDHRNGKHRIILI